MKAFTEGVQEGGIKAAGLKWAAALGLRVPSTLVFDWDGLNALSTARAADSTEHDGPWIIRPSANVPFTQSQSVSGLHPSVVFRTDAQLDEVRRRWKNAWRHETHKWSYTLSFVVQPYLDVEVSGLAHIYSNSKARVLWAVGRAHGLSEGLDNGYELQVSLNESVRCTGLSIQEEALHAKSDFLSDFLCNALPKLTSREHPLEQFIAVEIEWLVAPDKATYIVQIQPLLNIDLELTWHEAPSFS